MLGKTGTITIINIDQTSGADVYYLTQIPSAVWSAVNSARRSKDGDAPVGAYVCRISADACVDFVDASVWASLTDKESKWTLHSGDIVCFGAVSAFDSISDIATEHFTVTEFADGRESGALGHIRIGGSR